MIRIQNIPLPIGGGEEQLRKRAARLLGLNPGQLRSLTLARQSIDARKKSDVHYVCTVHVEVDNEARIMARCRDKNVSLHTEQPYAFPPVRRTSPLPPVVVGMGPAGLFAALFLARNRVIPIVLERGRPVEERAADVERFWATGVLDTASNVQFGEGGAGTFSDGKLTTGTHDPRISTVFRTLVEAGAPADILYQHKPHIGTDILRDVVRNVRRELLALGCDVRFGHRLAGLDVRDGVLRAVAVDGPGGRYDLPCDALVLSPGHSARDTFQMLLDAGVPMAPKPFAIGVRIEHAQAALSEAQFGPAWERLPAADYKLACHLPTGRSAFTFCVCPGGQVVASASEEGRVVTNGMSYHARSGKNANAAVVVSVNGTDFANDPRQAIAFQRELEAKAYAAGRVAGPYAAPAENIRSFLEGQGQLHIGSVEPTYDRGVTAADLGSLLPAELADTLRAGLRAYEHKIAGYTAPDAILTGLETRTSSPVRLKREENFECTQLAGLYPCGEGAGYAGGIMSAAVDGLRVARAIISRYAPAEG